MFPLERCVKREVSAKLLWRHIKLANKNPDEKEQVFEAMQLGLNNGPPKRCECPHPQNLRLEFSNVTWQKGPTEVTKLRVLRWGHYPALSGYTLNITTCVLPRGRRRGVG